MGMKKQGKNTKVAVLVIVMLALNTLTTVGQDRRLPEVKTRHISEIRLSDPAILADSASQTY